MSTFCLMTEYSAILNLSDVIIRSVLPLKTEISSPHMQASLSDTSLWHAQSCFMLPTKKLQYDGDYSENGTSNSIH